MYERGVLKILRKLAKEITLILPICIIHALREHKTLFCLRKKVFQNLGHSFFSSNRLPSIYF